jgi:predicted DNA-binding transcriptional regulator AlpA
VKQNALTSAHDPAALRHALGYIDEHEVCILLGIALPTLRNRLSIGTAPPSFKVGNRHLFKVAEVDAWIRRRRVHRASA